MNPSQYPEVEMSVNQLNELQIPVQGIDLNAVPIGFQFRCCPSRHTSEIVIGTVVKGEDAFVAQWGSGLSVPDRFVNRFKVKLTGSEEEIKMVRTQHAELARQLPPKEQSVIGKSRQNRGWIIATLARLLPQQ